MKLKLKFIFLSILAILCILIITRGSYNSLVQIINVNKNIAINAREYIERENYVSEIYNDTLHALYYNAKNDADSLKSVSDQINTFNSQDILFHDKNSFLYVNFLSSAKELINNLNSTEANTLLTNFEKNYLLVTQNNKTFYEQDIHPFITDNNTNFKPRFSFQAIASTAFAIVIISLVLLFTYANIFNPLSKIISFMTSNSQNDIPFVNRTDEIGDIARALQLLHSTSIEKSNLEESSKLQMKKSQEERYNSMLNIYNNFETKVKSIVDMVALAVEKMNTSSKSLGKLALSTQNETSLLSSTSQETKNNIEQMSKSTTEFNSAVNEISSQITNSLEYSKRASEQADQVNSVVLDLDTKANAVTSIIDIINNITSQIDLLALNATIEAARAGEMGKGFAVVANEIKALATQTSKATEQINFQISGIQSSTNKVVASIHDITESVKNINKNSESITSAVHKQSTSSSFISQEMDKVVSIFNTVSTRIEKVSDSSNQYGKTANEIDITAEELLKQTNMLHSEIDKFLSSLKMQ